MNRKKTFFSKLIKKIETALPYEIIKALFVCPILSIGNCLVMNLVIIKEKFYNRTWDMKLGINTRGKYTEKEEASLCADEVKYFPTFYSYLKKMTNHLKMSDKDIFVDLGCGKGRAIFYVAATQKVKKIIGVELRGTLVENAKKNLNNLKLDKIDKDKIEILHCDAADFDAREGTIFFMYSPFGWQTLKHVLDNIKKSLETNPRPVRILFLRASESKVLLDMTDWLVADGEIDKTNIFTWHSK